LTHGRGGREHDRALRLLELRNGEAGEPHRREQRQLERLLPRRVVEVRERTRLRTAGVHDEDIDAAEGLRGAFDEGPTACLGAHVRGDARGGADLPRDPFDALALARADRDARALRDELRGDRAPETFARGGHEHPLVPQFQVHR